MIIMKPPAGAAPFRKYKFACSGREVRASTDSDTLICIKEDEARELELEGWTRLSKLGTDDLRKAANAEAKHNGYTITSMPSGSVAALRQDADAAVFRRLTKSEPPRRVEFGEVDAGRHGRLMTSFDQGADVLSVHGVNIDLNQIDEDQADGIRAMAGMFLDEMQDSRQQAGIKAMIGAFVERIIDRHDFVGSAVRRIKHHQRFGT